MTAISPNNLEFYHRNGYYPTDEQHLEAIGNAMNVEYRAIVDAGFVLQIDDPRMATHYNRTPDASIEDCRKFIAQRVEAVNLALKGIPRERVRFHTCYSVNIAPRVYDMELRRLPRPDADASTPRRSRSKPPTPGTTTSGRCGRTRSCPTTSSSSRASCRTACIWSSTRSWSRSGSSAMPSIVGRERVLASNDCGFATSAAGDEVQHRGRLGEAGGPGRGRPDRIGAAVAAKRRGLKPVSGAKVARSSPELGAREPSAAGRRNDGDRPDIPKAAKFPVLLLNFRVLAPEIPCSDAYGIRLKTLDNIGVPALGAGARRPKFEKFPVLFPVNREFGCRDGFDNDCVRHHALCRNGKSLRDWRIASNRRASAWRLGLRGDCFRKRGDFGRVVSGPRIPIPRCSIGT